AVLVVAALQAFDRDAGEVVHTQVGVQGGGKVEGGIAADLHLQGDAQPRAGQRDRQAAGEGMRPVGATGAVAQFEMRRIVGYARARPVEQPREAVLAQHAAVGELGKDHRNAAADRAAGVELRALAEEQALAPVGGNPRQHLRAVQGDQGGGALVAEADAAGAAVVEGVVRQGHVRVVFLGRGGVRAGWPGPQSSPISSCHTRGFAAIQSRSIAMHPGSARSTTSTPFARSQSWPPWKFTDSPITTVPMPNWRTSPLQYQHGESVVTMMV